MKIAVFADLHAHNFPEFNTYSDRSGSSRLDAIIDSLIHIRGYCIEHGINVVLFAGDMFHLRAKIPTLVWNAVYDIIKTFYENGIVILAIAGNHDQVDNSDVPKHSLHAFNDLPGVTVYSDVGIHQLPGGVRVLCVPYSRNTDRLKEIINYAIDIHPELLGDYPICMFHLGISGGVTGSKSYPLSEAFTPEDLYPDFFKWVVGGHFHKHQLLGGHRNMMYVGSPIQHDFGDAGDERGFVVLDTEHEVYQFVNIPNPEFVELQFDEGFYTQHILKGYANAGHYVKMHLKESQVQAFQSICPPNLLYKLELEREYVEQTRVDVKVGMTFDEIISRYAEEFNPEAKEIGLQILREVEADV